MRLTFRLSGTGRLSLIAAWLLVACIGLPTLAIAQPTGFGGGPTPTPEPQPQPEPQPADTDPSDGTDAPDVASGGATQDPDRDVLAESEAARKKLEDQEKNKKEGTRFFALGSISWYPQQVSIGDLSDNNGLGEGSQPYFGFGLGVNLAKSDSGIGLLISISMEIAGNENLFSSDVFSAKNGDVTDFASTSIKIHVEEEDSTVGPTVVLTRLEHFQESSTDLEFRGTAIASGTVFHHSLLIAGIDAPTVLAELPIAFDGVAHASVLGLQLRGYVTENKFDIDGGADGSIIAGSPIVGAFFKWLPFEGMVVWVEGGAGATINEKGVGPAFFGRLWVEYATPKIWGHVQFVFSIDTSVLGLDYTDRYIVDAKKESGLFLWFKADFRLTLRIWI